MTPMPKKKLHIKDLHTFSEGGMTNTANISYSNQVKIQTFLEWISQLENEDQELYMTKIDHLAQDAKKRWYTIDKPHSALPPIKRDIEADSGSIVRNLEFR